MENFTYCTPTKLIFGKDAVKKLPKALKPYGTKVLLTYGGGSIKKMGLYDEVKKLLEGFEVYELSGIAPNPKYNPSVLEGVRLCKEHKIDVVLAVGGGSVLDCSKAICAGACYEGEPWDLITYRVKAKEALPLVDILTLAAARMWVAMVMPLAASTCWQMAPAATSGAVMRPEKWPPPRLSCQPPYLA